MTRKISGDMFSIAVDEDKQMCSLYTHTLKNEEELVTTFWIEELPDLAHVVSNAGYVVRNLS